MYHSDKLTVYMLCCYCVTLLDTTKYMYMWMIYCRKSQKRYYIRHIEARYFCVSDLTV